MILLFEEATIAGRFRVIFNEVAGSTGLPNIYERNARFGGTAISSLPGETVTPRR